MKRRPKISYKTYQNERLKPVWFHGKEVHPLYVQVIFNRQPIYFKSYYFDLLSQPKYTIRSLAGNRAPALERVVEREEELIRFIIDRLGDEFSLELFQKDYEYYSQDLLSPIEEGFKNYMGIFFHDEGLPVLATMTAQAGQMTVASKIIQDFRRSLKPDLYNKLLENARYYSPPYLPLQAFAQKKAAGSLPVIPDFLLMPLYEWTSPETKVAFSEFIKQAFPEYGLAETLKEVDTVIKKL